MAVSIDAVVGQRENEGLIGDNDTDAAMGGGPQGGLIGGSGYQQMDEGVEDSPTAPDTAGMPDDPSFSGSNAIVEVDTFEDIQAAQMARDVRVRGNAWNSGETGGYAGYAVYKQNDPYDRLGSRQPGGIASGGYTPAGARRGSVNLTPRGINVGYRSAFNQTKSFDQLDASTKAAVKAAQVISQSEDETENAIAQMWSAFQEILSKAKKNTTNRQMDTGSE